MLLKSHLFHGAFSLIIKDAIGAEITVLILTTNECDSICGARIFTSLLQKEFIRYSHIPISCEEDFKNIQIPPSIQSLVLINCGGTIDIMQHIPALVESSITVYIFDSHLPHHPSNINDPEQIVVFEMKESTLEDKMDEAFEGFYFHSSVSRIMYSLAVSLNKDCPEFLWLAIVGHTDLYLHDRINHNTYLSEINKYFKDDVAKFSQDKGNRNVISLDGNIIYEKDFKFMLYRHWNFYDSLFYSKYVASRLGTWKTNGISKIQSLLVRMGIPLQDSKEQWCYMKPEIKNIIYSKIENVALEFGLNNITFPSFRKNIGYDLQVSAADTVYAITALLEIASLDGSLQQSSKSQTEWQTNFWAAYDALSNSNFKLLETGLQLAISLQKAIIRTGTALIDGGLVVSTRRFRYVFLANGPDHPFFLHPLAVTKLGQFIIETLVESKKAKKPLVLVSFNEDKNTYLVVGMVDPSSSKKPNQNHFGLAFVNAADLTKTRVQHHMFDASVVEIVKDDINKFIQCLSEDTQ